MLEWLSAPPRAQDNQPDNSVADDAPTTPGPVFAARAFKHMIWGTPAAEEMAKQRVPRRRSDVEKKFTQTPPRRAASEQAKRGINGEPSPGRRPGILLTPGTERTRQKSVSFERKDGATRTTLSYSAKEIATPRDVPGRFPSPWTNKRGSAEDGNDNLMQPVRQKSSGSQSLQRPQTRRRSSTQTSDDITLDMSKPRSTSGTYWKTEYESYSSKSTSEMKKLAKKEQLAKKYARHRDSEASKLAEELRCERERVARLKGEVEEYVAKLAMAVLLYKPQEDYYDEKGEIKPEGRKLLDKIDAALSADSDRIDAEAARSKRHIVQQPRSARGAQSREEYVKKDEKPMKPIKHTDKVVQSDELSQMEGSDIWAAAAKPNKRRADTRSRDGDACSTDTLPAREPLKSREVNPIQSSPFPVQEKATSPTKSYRRHDYENHEYSEVKAKVVVPVARSEIESGKIMSDERKEAARRRLEEKKRMRQEKETTVAA